MAAVQKSSRGFIIPNYSTKRDLIKNGTERKIDFMLLDLQGGEVSDGWSYNGVCTVTEGGGGNFFAIMAAFRYSTDNFGHHYLQTKQSCTKFSVFEAI